MYTKSTKVCTKLLLPLLDNVKTQTVKAGTQERGTEIRCIVRQKYDERACACCEGAHGYRRNC